MAWCYDLDVGVVGGLEFDKYLSESTIVSGEEGDVAAAGADELGAPRLKAVTPVQRVGVERFPEDAVVS